jgi:hypothetical protein
MAAGGASRPLAGRIGMATGSWWGRCGAGLAIALVGAASPSQAADKFLGSITVDSEKVSLTHGLALTDGAMVTVHFYGAPLDAKDEAWAVKSEGVLYGVFKDPNVRLDLSLKRGTTRADPASFAGCHVGFYRFKAGLYDWNSNGADCGLLELNGDVKVGGVVHGRLKGHTEGFPEGGHRPSYAWDIDFTATLRADH